MKIIVLISLITSCSSLKRQQFYTSLTGALIGGSVGALIGKSLSPNKHSNQLNTIIGASIGSTFGGTGGFILGTYFWQEDPRNTPLNPIILEKDILKANIPIIKYKTVLPKNIKKIPIEGKVPNFLKSKVKKGHVLVFEIPEYEELTESGVIYHEKHQAFQYTVE